MSFENPEIDNEENKKDPSTINKVGELEAKPFDPMETYNRLKKEGKITNQTETDEEIIDPTNAMQKSYEEDKLRKEMEKANVGTPAVNPDEVFAIPKTEDKIVPKIDEKKNAYWKEVQEQQKITNEERIAKQNIQIAELKAREEEIKKEKEEAEKIKYENEKERLETIKRNEEKKRMDLGNESASLYQEGLRKEELDKEQIELLKKKKENEEILALMHEEEEKQRQKDVIRLKDLEEASKTKEQKLEENRALYAIAYKKHFEGKSTLNKTWQSLRATAGFPKITRESNLPQEIQDLKKVYDESKIAFGKEMFQKEKDRLIATGKTPLEVDVELKEYKANTIFNKIIVEERMKLQSNKVEALPKKEAGILKKSLNWYLKQNRFKKAIIATALFTVVAASIPGSALAGAGSVATYATGRLGRSLIGGQLGLGATKLYDIFNKDKSGINRQISEENLKKSFADSADPMGSLKNMEKNYESILQQEQKAKRKRIVHKALIGMAVGAGTSAVLGNLEQITDLAKKIDLPEKTGGTEIPQENTPPVIENPTEDTPEIKKPPTPPTNQEIAPPTADKVDVVESTEDVKVDFSSRGAIGTIQDLQEKLRAHPELHKDAVSEEIMKGDAAKLAEKFGMYRPGEVNESAMLSKGGSLEIRNGNLVYHENANDVLGHTLELGNGVAGPEEEWGGKMFDYNGKNSIPEGGARSTIVGENSEIINSSRPASGFKIAGESIPNNNQNEIVYTERVLPPHERINPNKIYHTEKVFKPASTVNPEMYGVKGQTIAKFGKDGMLENPIPTVNPDMYVQRGANINNGLDNISNSGLDNTNQIGIDDPNFSFHGASALLQEQYLNREIHHDINEVFGTWNGTEKVGGWESRNWQYVKDQPITGLGQNINRLPEGDPYKELMGYINGLYEQTGHMKRELVNGRAETVEHYIKRAIARTEEIKYAQSRE